MTTERDRYRGALLGLVTERWWARSMQAVPGWLRWALVFGMCVLGSIGATLILPVIIIGGAMLLDPVVATATRATSFLNPSGTFLAVVEQVDNGMGYGQGRAYDEIHLIRRGTMVHKHGNDSETVIFCDDIQEMQPQVHWTDDTHLTILYERDAYSTPFMRPDMHGVSVRYEKRVTAH